MAPPSDIVTLFDCDNTFFHSTSGLMFWSLIEPTPFVLMVFSCAALPGFHNVKHPYHLRFPISQLLSSH
jgi:hypothetical protein